MLKLTGLNPSRRRSTGRERPPGNEYRRARWEREPYTAGETMTRDVKSVIKDASLESVARIMKDENCGIVPVVDESQRLVGVVTDRDMVIRTLPIGKTFTEVTVADVMSEEVEAATPDEPLTAVADLMGRKQIRRVPVVDEDDRLLGIISMADIANRAECDEDLKEALKMISVPRSFVSRQLK